jgi:hypothetical protein
MYLGTNQRFLHKTDVRDLLIRYRYFYFFAADNSIVEKPRLPTNTDVIVLCYLYRLFYLFKAKKMTFKRLFVY